MGRVLAIFSHPNFCKNCIRIKISALKQKPIRNFSIKKAHQQFKFSFHMGFFPIQPLHLSNKKKPKRKLILKGGGKKPQDFP